MTQLLMRHGRNPIGAAAPKRSVVALKRGTHRAQKLRCQTRKWWFPVLITIITIVAVYDTVLIVLFRDTIRQMEKNPIGVWLIEADRGSVGLFVYSKLTGTIIVIATLLYIRRFHIRRSVPITTTIALWQTLLFGYLTFA